MCRCGNAPRCRSHANDVDRITSRSEFKYLVSVAMREKHMAADVDIPTRCRLERRTVHTLDGLPEALLVDRIVGPTRKLGVWHRRNRNRVIHISQCVEHGIEVTADQEVSIRVTRSNVEVT